MPEGAEGRAIQAAVEDLEGAVEGAEEGAGRGLPNRLLVVLEESQMSREVEGGVEPSN